MPLRPDLGLGTGTPGTSSSSEESDGEGAYTTLIVALAGCFGLGRRLPGPALYRHGVESRRSAAMAALILRIRARLFSAGCAFIIESPFFFRILSAVRHREAYTLTEQSSSAWTPLAKHTG